MTTRAFRKSSIKDVARRAGVSTTTVSYFVNGREDVCAEATAQRIRAAITDLQYTPSSLTRGLRHGATHTIGVCLYSPLDPELIYGNLFFERLWRGVVRETDTHGLSLLHYPLSVRGGGSSDAFLDGRVDGLLFQGLDTARARKVAQAGMPAVMLARWLDLPDGCGAVHANQNQAAALAMEHLFTFGHRRIAHLAGPARPHRNVQGILEGAEDSALMRLNAYVNQMADRGVYDPALVGYADAWQNADAAVAEIVAGWLQLPDPPTAVFCANDAIAVSVIAAAAARGVSVPQALSVIGIDDSPEARELSPALTSVSIPVEQIGQEGVRALLRLMGGESAEACRVALPVTEIVVRGSTAPCGHYWI